MPDAPAKTRTPREKTAREIELELELVTTRAVTRRLLALPPARPGETSMACRIARGLWERFGNES